MKKRVEVKYLRESGVGYPRVFDRFDYKVIKINNNIRIIGGLSEEGRPDYNCRFITLNDEVIDKWYVDGHMGTDFFYYNGRVICIMPEGEKENVSIIEKDIENLILGEGTNVVDTKIKTNFSIHRLAEIYFNRAGYLFFPGATIDINKTLSFKDIIYNSNDKSLVEVSNHEGLYLGATVFCDPFYTGKKNEKEYIEKDSKKNGKLLVKDRVENARAIWYLNGK
jgi:hypothetical protein